jgi:uncharacterized membrane protein YedE/YeeE
VSRPLFAAGAAGLLFGAGLQWAGMTDPRKVLAFLDVTGVWDPSLLLVLGGATGLCLLVFPWLLRRGRPLWAERFHLSTLRAVDAPLCAGAALFGIGWGLAGYCPGPAVAGLALGNHEVLWFLPAMLVGAVARHLQARPRA